MLGLIKERLKEMHGLDIQFALNLFLHEVSWKSRAHVRDNVFRETLMLIANDDKNVNIGKDISYGELGDMQRGF